MNEVTVDKKKLLDIVRGNKDKHVEDFSVALNEWHVQYDNMLKELQRRSRSGNFVEFNTIKMPKPVSFEKEYSKAIRMLELSVDDQIDLSDYEFSQLVLDEWDWKDRFSSTNNIYSISSSVSPSSKVSRTNNSAFVCSVLDGN